MHKVIIKEIYTLYNFKLIKKLVIKKVFFYLQATWHPWEVQTDWSVVKVPVCPEAMASCLLSFAEKREAK